MMRKKFIHTTIILTSTLLTIMMAISTAFSAAAAQMPNIAQDVLPSDTSTDTPTNTPTNTATDTPTNTPTNTSTNTPTDTATNTPTNTPTNTATDTPTDTPTNTPTNTATDTPTNTPTNTATNTPTDTPTNTPTNTATDTPTNTPTNTATDTPTNTPTNTATNTATNTPTPTQNKQAFTPGYWKNHQTQLTALLPVSLGNYVVNTTQKATAVFKVMNCSSTKPNDAIGCLAGHLLAAKLNVKNGSSSCISPTITKADAFLSGQVVNGVTGINYTGPTGTYKLFAAQRKLAITLKSALDTYNNNLGCPIVMNANSQLASTSTQVSDNLISGFIHFLERLFAAQPASS